MIIETVKQAEDGNGLIVRLYEGLRRRGTVTLRTDFPLAGAWRTNLLEENQAALDVGEHEVQLRHTTVPDHHPAFGAGRESVEFVNR